jgi:exo-beta-1,3-glucanase (GH17 family)
MHPTAAITLLLTIFSPATAYFKGLNFGADLPNGACRLQSDYLREFQIMKSNPPNFDTIRLFASSDCNQLAAAVPAALATGVKILVGIWTQDDTHYGNEKGALLGVLAKYPNWADWMVGISVGSEDLYRNEAPAGVIAEKIYDVRGMVRAKGVQVPVGHVDTWTVW